MPFLPAIMMGAGLLGKLFGGGAKESANQRASENDARARHNALLASIFGTQQAASSNALNAQDRGAMDRYQTRQAATTSALNSEEAGKLNRARLGLDAPTIRARQSVLGSMMENMRPVTVENMNPRLEGRVPMIRGGLSPEVLSDTTRAHGRDLQRAALQAQFTGSDIPAATDFRSGILEAPEMVDFQSGLLAPPRFQGPREAGGLERFMGGAGLLGSVLGGIGELINERPRSGNNLPIDPYGGGN